MNIVLLVIKKKKFMLFSVNGHSEFVHILESLM